MRSFVSACLLVIVAFSGKVSSFAPTRKSIQQFPSPLVRNKTPYLTSSNTQLSSGRDDDRENQNVNVNLIGNIDSVTLTAVGFGLIAFNFFVLANMGDAGIGGLVARIINTFQ